MKTFFNLILSLSIFFITGCSNSKPHQVKTDPAIELYNQLKKDLTDDFCKNTIEQTIGFETKQKIDLSESSVRLKKYPSQNVSGIVGEGFFEGKINKKRGTYFFRISLENNNYRRIKDSTAWSLKELIIQEAGKTERIFIAGKNVMEVGDKINIDGVKITLTFDNKICQKFTTSSRLTKEQIMKLIDCRERKKVGTVYLYLKGQKQNYAQYLDGMNALFMFSPDRTYEVEKTAYSYKFKQIKF